MKREKGFTLIELLITVAIIGILSAFAVPQYQDYVIESSKGTCQAEATAFKSAIEANILDPNRYDTPADRVSGYEGSCESITFSVDGSSDSTITATYSSPATGTYTLTRDTDGVWTSSES